MSEKLKVVFAPGCFDDFEGTPEELAAMVADIHQMVEDGTLMQNATRLSEEDEAELIRALEAKGPRQ